MKQNTLNLKIAYTMTVAFKVVAVSSNTNNFGLYQMVLLAKDGTSYKACANLLNLSEKGSTINVPGSLTTDGKFIPSFSTLGFELPEKITNAPAPVIAEVWGS